MRARAGAPDLVATPSQTVGPFFHFALATNEALGRIARPDASGERLQLRVRVLDGDGTPVPDALVEIYQADAEGRYAQPAFPGFGRLPTGEDGVCVFETIRPGRVPDGRGGFEAPHVNVCVLARGLLRHLCTRAYFPDGGLVDIDPVLALVPSDRRQTLMASKIEDGGMPLWEFVIRLQGDAETAFFDV